MNIVVDIFKSLAEKNRLRILFLLMQDEMCVCEIEVCLKMTQSNVSRHLTALKQSGVLDSYKKAQWAFYKVSDKFIKENSLLWRYLQEKLKADINYQADFENYAKCKLNNLCDI